MISTAAFASRSGVKKWAASFWPSAAITSSLGGVLMLGSQGLCSSTYSPFAYVLLLRCNVTPATSFFRWQCSVVAQRALHPRTDGARIPWHRSNVDIAGHDPATHFHRA